MSVGAVNKQTGDRIPTAGMPAIDNALDLTSVNPVQNAVITKALAGKADTGIVADDFDVTASYVIGNYCIHEGKLYRFKNNHSGAWSAADVEEVKITGELSAIKSGLTNLIVLRQQTITISSITANSSVTTPFQPEAVSGYSWAGFTPIVKTDGVMITVGWIGNAFRIIARNFNNSDVTNVDVEINWIFLKSA